MSPTQLVTSVLTVMLATTAGAVLVLARGATRRWAFSVLFACALVAAWSWTGFGRLQTISVDADQSETGPSRKKVRLNRPFHFHEFVHYYLGPKYFPELGYLGLYDCIALADSEIAAAEGHAPRVSGWVRDLDDVLADEPYEESLEACRRGARTRFSEERWEAFVSDLRALARMVDDGAWQGVVFDAGFNPPPSLVVVSHAVTSLVPMRAYLVATSIDLALLVLCFFLVRRAFGDTTAAAALVFFGTSLVSHYSWNGGSVLRYTWFAAIVAGLSAMKRGRWALAGALLGAATCDRLFPAAFAAFAAAALAMRARRAPELVRPLTRFGAGFGAAIVLLVLASLVVFDAASWRVFFARVLRHGDVYYVMHIGLKKVLTFREWVPAKDFHGHEGLARFREWNVALRETWRAMRPISVPIQAALAGGALVAASRRRPYEAAVLGGVVCMFAFNLPANYYYVVLALVPALSLRAAATSGKRRDLVVFVAFALFWTFTCLSPIASGDGIVQNHYVSTALLAFIVLWTVLWALPAKLQMRRGRPAP